MSPVEDQPDDEATVEFIVGYANGGDNDEDDSVYTNSGDHYENDSKDNDEEDTAEDVNEFELIVGYANGGDNDGDNNEENDEKDTAKDVNEFEDAAEEDAIFVLDGMECYDFTPPSHTPMIGYEPSTFDPFTWIPTIHNGTPPNFE